MTETDTKILELLRSKLRAEVTKKFGPNPKESEVMSWLMTSGVAERVRREIKEELGL